MSRKIVYAGLERCDFVYHLTNILSLVSGKIIVVDTSLSQDMFKSVCSDEYADIYEWRNIIFLRNVEDFWSSSELVDTDYVIEYVGMGDHEKVADFGDEEKMILCMPDYTRMGIEKAYETVARENGNTIYILRDYCTKKMTLKSLAIAFGISKEDIAGFIPLNTQDITAYISLTHNRHQNIKGLSDEMIDAITFVSTKILGIDRNMAVKLVAKSKKIK